MGGGGRRRKTMIILTEKKKDIREKTWGKIVPGKELFVFNSAISDIEKFVKKYNSTFGDDELFDNLGKIKERLASLTAVILIANLTKIHFRGTRPSHDDAVDWIANTIKTYKEGLFIRYPNIDYAWVFSNAMDAAGF
jgi:hypothetical protein